MSLATNEHLDTFLERIGRVPLLTAAEEQQLAYARDAGDDGALDYLQQANLRLVVSIAKRYVGHGLPIDDLIQEGCIGLHTAARRFDPSRGLKFSTYATWWIRQAVARAVLDSGRVVRLPVHLGESLAKVRRAREALGQELGRTPTNSEVAGRLGWPVSKLRRMLAASYAAESLDAPIPNLLHDNELTLGASLESADAPVPESSEQHDLAQRLRAVLAELTERRRAHLAERPEWRQSMQVEIPERAAEMLALRYGLADGEPHTLEEVGQAFGVTRERARQIEAEALAMLRELASVAALRSFLED
jgi:RNA polymerase primary sigma factor